MTTLPDLETMDRAGLARLWLDLLGGAVPPKMSQPMQRRFLAFEMQARAAGGPPPALIARLERIAGGDARQASPSIRPGGRLLRSWNGTTHVVDVLPDGYLWNGARHRSLSAIARAITGARWSGPRFFGLLAAEGGDGRHEAGVQQRKRKAAGKGNVPGRSGSTLHPGADLDQPSPSRPVRSAGREGNAR